MLFYAKQHTRVAVLVMLGLLLISNVWAGLRGILLGDMLKFNLQSIFVMLLGFVYVMSQDSLIYLVNWFVGFRPFLRAFDEAIEQLFGRIRLPAIVAGGLLAALGEETFFRGILQHEIGLVPAALLFALAHVGRGSMNLFAAWGILEGLLFGWLYQLTGNLLVPMVVHGLHDSVAMFIARYLYRRVLPPADTLFDWLHTLNQPFSQFASTYPVITQATPSPGGDHASVERLSAGLSDHQTT